ncbi:MAG: leucine-rich repeat protein, partial [Clostridia bacterium]|nr:leucine-rich repeat protein [Clostridia bacterium]
VPTSVTSIGSTAFYDCRSLVALNVKISIITSWDTSNGTFYNCRLTKIQRNSTAQTSGGVLNFLDYNANTSLTSFYLPSSITYIGGGTFAGWTSLQNVYNVSNVTKVGNEAFYNCTSLYSSWISSMTRLTELGDDMYGCTFKNCSSSNFTSVTFPSGFLNMHDGCFSGCTNLTCVKVPSSTIMLGDCSYVEDPFNGTGMGEYDFYRGTGNSSGLVFNFADSTVSAMTTLNLSHFRGNTYVSIGVLANFRNLNTIKLKYLDQGFAKGSYCTFASLFGTTYTTGMTQVYNNYYAPNTLRTVEALNGSPGTFCGGLKNCSMVTSFKIYNYWTSGMCDGCTNLEYIYIYANNTSLSISSSEFSGHTKLKQVYCDASSGYTITIGSSAFQNCTALQSVSLYGYTQIEPNAFSGCSSLSSAYMASTTWYVRSGSWPTTSYYGSTISSGTAASTKALYLRSTYASYYWKRF